MPSLCYVNSPIKSFLCGTKKGPNFRLNLANTESVARVTVKAVKDSATIDRDNVTIL